ncbi:MAG: hypothetical protein LWW94_09875, partial [Candidatus Desulfofervidaceae bacterium]|nr:hypothetical protein [Candidatus Desulfofervidaceae bacterium]
SVFHFSALLFVFFSLHFLLVQTKNPPHQQRENEGGHSQDFKCRWDGQGDMAMNGKNQLFFSLL